MNNALADIVVFLLNYSEPFLYAGIFLILFCCGLGLPIPEEITLLASGFLVQLGFIRLYPVIAIGFAGVLSGDLAMYSIGRKWGHGILTHRHMHKIFSEKRLARVRQFFCDHGSKTIFIARFITGFRVAAFLAAGTMGMRPGKFLILDLLGAIILVPLLILLGYTFGVKVGWLAEFFTRIDFLLTVAAVLGGSAGLSYFLWKRFKSHTAP